jgi:hypothetical protein
MIHRQAGTHAGTRPGVPNLSYGSPGFRAKVDRTGSCESSTVPKPKWVKPAEAGSIPQRLLSCVPQHIKSKEVLLIRLDNRAMVQKLSTVAVTTTI